MKPKATPHTKIFSMIDDFESWITPLILHGHPQKDVIGAYMKAFPGRTVLLLDEFYNKLNKKEPHGSE